MNTFLAIVLFVVLGCSKESEEDNRSSSGGASDLHPETAAPQPSDTSTPSGDAQNQNSNDQTNSPPPMDYAKGLKYGDLLPAIPQTNFIPSQNTFHGYAQSRTGLQYVVGASQTFQVAATSLDKLGVHQRSLISDVVDLGKHGVAFHGSFYLSDDPLTNILAAQIKMNVMVIVQPDGAVSLVSQDLAGRTDQQVLTVSSLTFDGGKRLYFLSAGRLRYIDLESREVFTATSDKLTVEIYDFIRPSGKIYLRARSWRTTNRGTFELTPDLEARPIFMQNASYTMREHILWTNSGLYQDMNAWNGYFLKATSRLPIVNIIAPSIDVMGVRLTPVGAKAATVARGIPANSGLTSLNGKLHFDGSNLFGYEIADSKIRQVRVHNLKYPAELASISSFNSPTISHELPFIAEPLTWLTFTSNEGTTLLRYNNITDVPERFVTPNSFSGGRLAQIDGKLYLIAGSQYSLVEFANNNATITTITTAPAWSTFDLNYRGQLFDINMDRILKYNFAMSRWDELFRITSAGCTLRKNLLVVAANGSPLGLVEMDCGAEKGLYAVAYQSWDNLSWESSSKLTNKIFNGSISSNNVFHFVSQANQNIVRVENNAIVLTDTYSVASTIEIKVENVEPAGLFNIGLPANFHTTGVYSNIYHSNSAVFIEPTQSPLRRVFATDLRSGTSLEIESLRAIDVIDNQPMGEHYFISGEKNNGTQSVAAIINPDLTTHTLTLPESIDISKLVKKQ